MNYWLVKTEPNHWSWDDQVKAVTTAWDGVKNAQALINLRNMKKGDRSFFYHSGKEKQIVGVVEVTRTAYPDPNLADEKLVVVEFKAIFPVKAPVLLKQIKADPKLSHLLLVRNSRLSVMPIDAEAWKRICKMAGIDP